jgi:hypothetical protein
MRSSTISAPAKSITSSVPTKSIPMCVKSHPLMDMMSPSPVFSHKGIALL